MVFKRKQDRPTEFQIRFVSHCILKLAINMNVTTSFWSECCNIVFKFLSNGRKCWLVGTGTYTIKASPFNTKHVLHCVHKMFTQGTHLHDAKKIFAFLFGSLSRNLTSVKCREVDGLLVFVTAILALFASSCRASFNTG